MINYTMRIGKLVTGFLYFTAVFIVLYGALAVLLTLGISYAGRTEFINLISFNGVTSETINAIGALSAPTALAAITAAVVQNSARVKSQNKANVETVTSMFAAYTHSMVIAYDSVLDSLRKHPLSEGRNKLMPSELKNAFVAPFKPIGELEKLLFSKVMELPRTETSTLILEFGAIDKTQRLFNLRMQAPDLTEKEFLNELEKARNSTVRATMDVINMANRQQWQHKHHPGGAISANDFRDQVLSYIKQKK